MKSYAFFEIQINGHVATVYLNNPKKSNSLSPVFWKEVGPLFEELDADPQVRAIIIAGRGGGFCAGLDFMGMASAHPELMEPQRKDDAPFRRLIHGMQDAINAVPRCSKPVIAAVHNFCVGAGMDLALACDFRLCSADAYFQAKEVMMAVVPDLGLIERLTLAVGEGLAREIAFTARKVDAAEARKINLANHFYDSYGKLMDAAFFMAEEIADNSPIAVQATKRAFNHMTAELIENSMRFAGEMNLKIMPSEDLMEAMSAMAEKRKPNFKGK